MTELRGRVTAADAPIPAAEVLAVAGDALAGHAETDADGRFALTVTPAPGLRLLARCRRHAAGLALAPAAEEDEVALRLEDVAPPWPVRFTVGGGLPDGFPGPVLRLVPLALGALTATDVKWAMRPVGERSDSAYLSEAMTADGLALLLQAGRWWFAARLVLASDARAAGAVDPPPLHAVAAQLADGTPLDAMRGGWVLPVGGPTAVSLTIGER